MTQKKKEEDKELLLKDLCARLSYRPKIKITYQQQGIKGTDEGNISYDVIEHIVRDLRNGVITDMQIYLRPMSSMTEEESNELQQLDTECDKMPTFDYVSIEHYRIFDWLNAHHFDYRGLIEKGLALEYVKLKISKLY